MSSDPNSGLDHPGKGHDPQCLVSTAYDVFRRLPIARTVQPMAHANEREVVKARLPQVPPGGILLFDRGYPSYDLIDFLQHHCQGYWLIRCPASATFPAVKAFVQSGQTHATITLTPPQSNPITLRAIRMILKTAVGRARVCGGRVDWQGATTPWGRPPQGGATLPGSPPVVQSGA